MDHTVDHLIRRVLDLDRSRREEIVEAVLPSLDESDTVDRAWLEEAHRRFDALRSGEARVIDHADVVDRLESVEGGPADWEDPIVAEVHRIREELLDEFGGDLDALAADTNRRLFAGEYGDVKIVRYPPKPPAFKPKRAAG